MPRLPKETAQLPMKTKELRELSSDELVVRRRELEKEMFHLRLQQQTGALEKPSVLRASRREVARVETVLTERARKTGNRAKPRASN
jgi:large subunit ribosomal protein L29